MLGMNNLKIGCLSGLMTIFEKGLVVVQWNLLQEIILVYGTPLFFLAMPRPKFSIKDTCFLLYSLAP